jgi:hypothetical protein
LFFTDETDTAVTAISYLTLIVNEGGAMKLTSTGSYTDRFVCVGGAWRLAHRDLKLDAPIKLQALGRCGKRAQGHFWQNPDWRFDVAEGFIDVQFGIPFT